MGSNSKLLFYGNITPISTDVDQFNLIMKKKRKRECTVFFLKIAIFGVRPNIYKLPANVDQSLHPCGYQTIFSWSTF